jgi:hypothetical protein
LANPRPVRIPRTPAAPRPAQSAGELIDHRPNRAGTQRAFRFAVLYVLALVILDVILVALDLSSSEGTRPAVLSGLRLFTAIAILLAVGSVIFALTPAPRFVELRTEGVVIMGRWGQRRWFPPLDRLKLHVARHYPAGILSSRPVDIVEVVDRVGHRRTYQLEAGLLEPSSEPSSA